MRNAIHALRVQAARYHRQFNAIEKTLHLGYFAAVASGSVLHHLAAGALLALGIGALLLNVSEEEV
jgi:hypothetical protein